VSPWDPGSWHLPTLIICRRCGEVMAGREEDGVLLVASDCGRHVEAHTLGFCLITWTYQRRRRDGRLGAADLDALAAVLGVRVSDFQKQVNKVFVNTCELNLFTMTDRPRMGSSKIELRGVHG
jgi:hypothetical protein